MDEKSCTVWFSLSKLFSDDGGWAIDLRERRANGPLEPAVAMVSPNHKAKPVDRLLLRLEHARHRRLRGCNICALSLIPPWLCLHPSTASRQAYGARAESGRVHFRIYASQVWLCSLAFAKISALHCSRPSHSNRESCCDIRLHSATTAIMATELTVQSERAFQKQPHIFLNHKGKKAKSGRVGKGGRRWYKDVGLGFRTPRTAIEGEYIGMIQSAEGAWRC